MKNSAVPERAIVPRCEIASSRLMPMPLSRMLQGALGLVRLDPDGEVGVAGQQFRLAQRLEAQLVVGVGGVGDQLAQEDFAVAVQRMDHELQQLTHLGLETQGLPGVVFVWIAGLSWRPEVAGAPGLNFKPNFGPECKAIQRWRTELQIAIAVFFT